MSEEEQTKDWTKVKEEAVEPALEHPSYEALEQKLTAVEQELDVSKQKILSLMAEGENIRRRTERDIENARRFGIEKFINQLIPVLDSLEQATLLAESDKALHEGLILTTKLFLEALDKMGVKQINPEGELFDPHTQEAMSMQIVEGVQSNTVLTVFQKGYLLYERVVRPARVIVAK